MNCGILVAGETGKSDFALFLGFSQGLRCTVRPDEQVGIVVQPDAVDLPEIEVIGLEALEGLVQHFGRQSSFAAVGADFGHEKDLVTAAFQALPIQSSDLPRWYSQQLSKKVMPLSTASCTI